MSAASMPAVVRSPHSAAARRALLTLLFLGGFLALAVAFGGSANAVSDAGHEARQAGGEASGLLKSEKASGKASGKKSGETRDRAEQAAAEAEAGAKGKAKSQAKTGKSLTGTELAERQPQDAHPAARRATSQVLGPFVDGVDSAGQITRPVGEAVQDVADSTGPPGGLGLGGLGGIGGDTPGEGGHQSHDGTGDDSCGAVTHGTGDRLNTPDPQGSRGLAPGAFLSAGAAHANAEDGLTDGTGEGAPDGRLPFGDTPAVPSPSTSPQYTADGQSQRGGPLQFAAVVDCEEHLVPPRSGAVSAADGTPTRERAGDVLEFPG
ncbi:hypothetical protein [Streptomyces marispadix]|uniref:Uncharacterized protein n=1 Tax=Streptomyces marispadix TaxID=2922868 RepID=A0ABS9T0U2_9ACTN|nr:hypothetical protein [Streptomyces marispadix]MCH6162151.1 hypothetical protein [Streptomyces marispadix]